MYPIQRSFLGVRVMLIAALGMLSSEISATESEQLGRLFFSQQQRADMDRQRQSNTTTAEINTAPTQSNSTTATETSAAPTPAHQEFKGVVVRGDGHHTYWLNDQARAVSQEPGTTERLLSGTQLRIKTQDRGVTLQPGQRYDANEDRVRDVYDRPTSPKTTTTGVTEPAQDVVPTVSAEKG